MTKKRSELFKPNAPRPTQDRLRIDAQTFYDGAKQFADAKKRQPLLDYDGALLVYAACVAKHIQEAKQGSYMRRTHCSSYLTTSDTGKERYLNDFEDLGPRWVNDADEIATRQGHKGWYTDDMEGNTLIGVVLCFARHGAPDINGNGYEPVEKALYMAGTRHSDWDGVTLNTATTDDMLTAARWADEMAEYEAEKCREADVEYQNEQKAEALQEEITLARQACLKLLRDMRPLRKGMSQFPESVWDALRHQVFEYIKDIRSYRKQIGELSCGIN